MDNTLDVTLFNYTFICYLAAMLIYLMSFWKERGKAATLGKVFLVAGLAMQVAGLVIRSVNARFMPVTNMYESLNFFSCSIVVFYLVLEHKTKNRSYGAFVLPVVFLLMMFTSLPTTPKDIKPLIPALQSQWLVWHVLLAFIGEAGFAIAFGASVMYLIRKRASENGFVARTFPSLQSLDTISYRAVAVGFPIFTLGALIFGAIWAKYAWGDYWSWDPKETWALITWIVYALYLHARIMYGWKGTVAAWISMIGFLATLFTLFGVNYLLAGLHSYS